MKSYFTVYSYFLAKYWMKTTEWKQTLPIMEQVSEFSTFIRHFLWYFFVVVVLALESLPLQVLEARTQDYHKPSSRGTKQKDVIIPVIAVSLTRKAGKCLKQTVEHKEVLFSQKGLLSRMYHRNTNADVTLRQPCCVTQASIKQRIGTLRRVSLDYQLPPCPATFCAVFPNSTSC